MAMHTTLRLQARTLFPSGAVEPIWQRLQAQLEHTLSPVSLRALILLLNFFPFKAAPVAPELPLHDIAAKSVQLWLSVSMNTFWDRLWLRFLARLAKWDTHVRFISTYYLKQVSRMLVSHMYACAGLDVRLRHVHPASE